MMRRHPSGRIDGTQKTRKDESDRRYRQEQWSGKIGFAAESNALDLEKGVFSLKNPEQIVTSLKRSAETSRRRKAYPYRSAMSMLVFYINRAGKNLGKADRARLEQAKDELREVFGKPPAKARAR